MGEKTIPDIIHQISQSLQQQSECIFQHKGNIGDSREKELIRFLEKVMPDRYGFSSGEMIDLSNNRSGQTDIIIYDKLFSPYFTDGSGKIVAPIDSVFGTIEVKSVLDDSALEQLKEQISTQSSLKRQEANGFQILPFTAIASSNKSKNDMIFSLFAFDTNLSHDTTAKKIIEKGINVHMVIVKDKFIILANNYHNLMRKNEGIRNISILKGENVISIFILLLQIYLNDCKLVGTDLAKLVNDLFSSFQRYTVKPEVEIIFEKIEE